LENGLIIIENDLGRRVAVVSPSVTHSVVSYELKQHHQRFSLFSRPRHLTRIA